MATSPVAVVACIPSSGSVRIEQNVLALWGPHTQVYTDESLFAVALLQYSRAPVIAVVCGSSPGSPTAEEIRLVEFASNVLSMDINIVVYQADAPFAKHEQMPKRYSAANEADLLDGSAAPRGHYTGRILYVPLSATALPLEVQNAIMDALIWRDKTSPARYQIMADLIKHGVYPPLPATEFPRIAPPKGLDLRSLVSAEAEARLRMQIRHWSFACGNLTVDELAAAVVIIFDEILKLPGSEHYRMDLSELIMFVLVVRRLYGRNVAYHNFYHAADVVQAAYFVIMQCGTFAEPYTDLSREALDVPAARRGSIKTALQTPIEARFDFPLYSRCTLFSGGYNPSRCTFNCAESRRKWASRPPTITHAHGLAMVVAALGHDTSHPGLHTATLLNANGEFRRRFSCLEHFHAVMYTTVLRAYWPTLLASDLSRVIDGTIRATDMSLHHNFIRDAQRKAVDDSGLLRLCLILKAVDIMNVSRSRPCAVLGAVRISKELSELDELERAAGVPTSMTEDMRRFSQLERIMRGHKNFVKRYARPLFEELLKIHPAFGIFLVGLEVAESNWEDLTNKVRACLAS